MRIIPLSVGEVNKCYLCPGEIFSSRKPHMVDTILGSCIAVFLWDPALQFGNINHYMLPVWNQEGSPSFRYGNIAIPELINLMLKMGSCRKNIKAKIFGGSKIGRSNGVFNIGGRNIILAQDILKNERIPIISYSVGGCLGRKVIFYSASGEVLISYFKQDISVIDQQNSDCNFNLSEK